MRSRTVAQLIVGAAVLAVILLWRLRPSASPPVVQVPRAGATTPRQGARPSPAPPTDPDKAYEAREAANGLVGTVEEAWAALAPIEAHLLANEDPDTWLDDLVNLEKVIQRLPMKALAILVRTARQHVDPRIADWLVPVIYIAVGRAGFGDKDALIGERIADESPKTLWAVVAGMAVEHAPHPFSDDTERKFWLMSSFTTQLVRDREYPRRYWKKKDYPRNRENPNHMDPEEIRVNWALQSPDRIYFNAQGVVDIDGNPTLLDRLERIPKCELVAEENILKMFPKVSLETSARAAKWAADRDMHTSFRVWGIEDWGDQHLDQALALARERIAAADEDPKFRLGMVEWLNDRDWNRSGDSYSPEPRELLVDSYYQQKANGTLLPRLILYVVGRPEPRAVAVAQDVLSSVSNEEAHLSVVDGLYKGRWDQSAEKGYLAEWQSLLMTASRSPYEKVRSEAAVVSVRKALQGYLDPQAVSSRLIEMAKEDPSESVRQSAQSELKYITRYRK